MRPRTLVALVLIVPALVVLGIRLAPDTGPPPATAASSPAAPVPADPPAPHSSTTPASVDPARDRAVDTASAFTRAWLDPRPAARARGLKASATADLAGQLAGTDPRRIPSAALTSTPALTAYDAGAAARARADLSNHTALTLDLIADPTAPTGWRVADVTPA